MDCPATPYPAPSGLLGTFWVRSVASLQGLDIGPDSIKLIEDALSDAKTVVWNGPAGVFEFPAFAKVRFFDPRPWP